MKKREEFINEINNQINDIDLKEPDSQGQGNNNKILTMNKNEQLKNDEIDELLFNRICLIRDRKMLRDSSLDKIVITYMKENENFNYMNIEPIKIFYDEQIDKFESNIRH